MSNKGIAQLGPQGYITVGENPSDVLQMEFSNMFETDHSQSVAWADKVTSVQWLIKENVDNPEILISALEVRLTDVYTKYFDTVECTVTIPNIDDSELTLNIYVKVTVGGENYQLGREMVVNPNRDSIKLVAAINR